MNHLPPCFVNGSQRQRLAGHPHRCAGFAVGAGPTFAATPAVPIDFAYLQQNAMVMLQHAAASFLGPKGEVLW